MIRSITAAWGMLILLATIAVATESYIWLAAYLLVGVIISCGTQINNRPLWNARPGQAFGAVTCWPVLLCMLAPQMDTLEFRGKVIWKRKDS